MSRKRGQNEGGIYFYKRLNKWAAQVTIEGKRKTKYFDKKGDALKWLREMQNQIDQGLTLQGMNSTLGEYMHQWLESASPSLRPNTVADYAGYIRRHIAPELGDIKIAELRPDQVQKLYNEKAREGYSQTTIRMIHAVLHRALNQAVRWGIIMRNPASVVNKPKPRRKEMKIWNETEVVSFLSLFTGTRFDALFYLAVTTGMRKGELLGLKWNDLDWGNQELNIQRQLVRVTGKGRVFQEPKTAAGRRVVVLGNGAIERLRKHQAIQDDLRQFAGIRWKDHGVIFTTTIGTPENPDNVYHRFKGAIKKAGLPEIRFHDLRHTAATLMLKQGIHPKVVQERLGHSDISLTLNTYSHVTPAMQQDAADKMDELFTVREVYPKLYVLEDVN